MQKTPRPASLYGCITCGYYCDNTGYSVCCRCRLGSSAPEGFREHIEQCPWQLLQRQFWRSNTSNIVRCATCDEKWCYTCTNSRFPTRKREIYLTFTAKN